MRVLILGAAGMLGHKLCQSYRDRFDTWATVRADASMVARYSFIDPTHIMSGVDASNFDTIVECLASTHPDVVVNCIGIIKQLPSASNPLISLTINAVLPHRLAALCQATGARLIHISTDCVFSGRKGMYIEKDVSDAEDLYGRTKYLGEVAGPGCLTLRTSIIGRELATTSGLVEWFLSSKGSRVRGYSRAIYTGFTTIALAKIIGNIIANYPELTGIYHVSSSPIDKYHLLNLIRDAYRIEIQVDEFPDIVIDRSLDSSHFRKMVPLSMPQWPEMISEMALDPTPYEAWRNLSNGS